MTLQEIADYLDGQLIGNPQIIIHGVSEIQKSIPDTITFLGNMKYKKYLNNTLASAIIVNDSEWLQDKDGILIDNPQLAMAKLLSLFHPKSISTPQIHETVIINTNVKIGQNCSIGPGVVIENGVHIGDNANIGANTVIGFDSTIGINADIKANVTIYDNINIGNNVIIHSGTIIGSDGFGFVTSDNIHEKIPQVGTVRIGNHVEIGSNCSIDRATMGVTSIGDMTKIDNLAHIAHNVIIGKGCLITGAFAIAGSSEVGDYCSFGGQVGVGPHIKIGPGSTFAAKSGITKSLKGGKVYAGFPAREIYDYNKREALLSNVDRMRTKLDQLIKDQ